MFSCKNEWSFHRHLKISGIIGLRKRSRVAILAADSCCKLSILRYISDTITIRANCMFLDHPFRGIISHRFCINPMKRTWRHVPSVITYLDLDLRSSHSCWGIARRDFSTDSWSLATLRTPLQLTLISCKSSWNVCRQVFLGRPLLLRPPSGSHCIATPAGLSGGSRSICPVNVNLLTLTIFYRSAIPALFINSSLVMSLQNFIIINTLLLSLLALLLYFIRHYSILNVLYRRTVYLNFQHLSKNVHRNCNRNLF